MPESLVIRPARATDRDGMLRITKDVWDGTDYVPYVWQRWLADPSGYLCVATLNGQVVGLQHAYDQGDGSAWLEGIRVDETVRGQGIGAAMLQHGLEWARHAGCSVARLSTWSGNESSMRIARKGGMREAGRFEVTSGPAAAQPDSEVHVRLAHAGDLDTLGRTLLSSPTSGPYHRYYTEGWTAYRLTAARLRLLVAVHAIAIAESETTPSVGIVTASVGRPFPRLGYLHGSSDGLAAIVAWIQAQAGVAGMERVRAVVPYDRVASDVLQSAGFASSSGFSMVLWETSL